MPKPKSKKKNYLRLANGMREADLKKSVAEDDPYLSQYYIGADRYLGDAIQRDCSASVFVGPKGVGKSAVLQMVRNTEEASGNTNRLINIRPNDLAFNALAKITSRNPLLDAPQDNQLLFKSLWDYVLCAEVLRREHPNLETWGGMLSQLFGPRHKHEQKKLAKLAREEDGSVQSMTARMLALVDEISVEGQYAGATAAARVKLKEGTEQGRASDLKMLQLIHNVSKKLPATLRHDYYILIDDLDLEWRGTPLQNAFLGSLLLSIKQLSYSDRIKFVVSMRQAIYRQVDLEERDKFEDYVCEMSWSKEEIQEMVARRLSYFFSVKPQEVFGGVFPVDGFDLVWQHSDETPRDCINAAVACVKAALKSKQKSVRYSDVRQGIKSFSESRVDNLASHCRHTYPQIRLVFQGFSGRQKQFQISTIEEVALEVAMADRDPDVAKQLSWVIENVDRPYRIAEALLRTGFLQLKDGRDSVPRVPSEHEICDVQSRHWYAIHPRYHAGLQVEGHLNNIPSD